MEFCPGTQPASLLIDALCSCYQPLGREAYSNAHLGQGQECMELYIHP